jgi:hypothetical protein
MSWIAAIRNAPDFAVRRVGSPWLVHEFVASYVAWRAESTAVKEAYEHWTSKEADDLFLAFAAYRAALDREELAARAYQECAERIAGRTGSVRRSTA